MTVTYAAGPRVNTVLGPVPADELGAVSVQAPLLVVVPGAQFAHDIALDRAEVFATLAHKLRDFRDSGGGTLVDNTGMFHGRDLNLYEALSRATGVHIVASTGMGPEEMLGGYFLTPQTNPPTPWPAERFTELFAQEVTDGMVVPRLERRNAAGLVVAAASAAGMTATEESLFRAAARTAVATGVPASIRFGADALHDLDVVLDEGLPPRRVVVTGLDRVDAAAANAPLAIAQRGSYVALDHVGLDDDPAYVSDDVRAAIVGELLAAGFGDQILLSSDSVGVAVGEPGSNLGFGYVLATFAPFLASQGVGDDALRRILVDNPRDLLSVLEPTHA